VMCVNLLVRRSNQLSYGTEGLLVCELRMLEAAGV
jgi:hypothetical protein